VKTSPTRRSFAYLVEQGYRPAIVERWNPFARRRQDLYGILDIIAVRKGETLGVQTTTAANISARIRKVQDSSALADLRAANWRIHVHGWSKRKKSGRWEVRVEDIS